MKRPAFIALLNQTHTALSKLTDTKGIEYARSDDDQLANFHRLAEENDITAEAVCAVYMTKHLDAIKFFIKSLSKADRPTYSEPITGRIDDAILYLILLKALVNERYAKENPL